ncbi:MAG: DUF4397 domain-containing protein [Terriglobales bacterium]
MLATKLPLGEEEKMSRWLRAVPLMLALAVLSVFAASCGNSNPARVRFVHAIQDAGALDIDVNGTKDFPGVSFREVLPNQPGYTNVPSGSDTVEGFAAGTTTEAFSESVSLGAGTAYTLIATGFETGTNGSNVVLLSIPDNIPTPPAGEVAFRVIHASPSGPGTVDVYIDLNPSSGPVQPITIQGLAYTQASTYISLPYNPNDDQIPPGFTVYVTASGNTQPPYLMEETIDPGTSGAVRTIVLTDNPYGTSMDPSYVELDDAD